MARAGDREPAAARPANRDRRSGPAAQPGRPLRQQDPHHEVSLSTVRRGGDATRQAREQRFDVNQPFTGRPVSGELEQRLAELVGEGQAAGSIAGPHVRADVRSADISGLRDLGIDRRRLAEARRLAAGYTDSDIVELAADRTSRGEELTQASLLKSNAQLIHSSESVEWYTPPGIIDAARR